MKLLNFLKKLIFILFFNSAFFFFFLHVVFIGVPLYLSEINYFSQNNMVANIIHSTLVVASIVFLLLANLYLLPRLFKQSKNKNK